MALHVTNIYIYTHTHMITYQFLPGTGWHGSAGRNGIAQNRWQPVRMHHVVVDAGGEGVKEGAVVDVVPPVTLRVKGQKTNKQTNKQTKRLR